MPQPGQPIRVLLVDDEPAFIVALQALLEHDERIDVVAAADNGARAIELAESTQPDVALVDLALPGMDGFEITRRLRVSAPALRVVTVSGHSRPEAARDAIAAGADGFLLKGALHDEIADAIVEAAGDLTLQ